MRLLIGVLALIASPLLLADQQHTQAGADVRNSGQGYNGNFSLNQATGFNHQQANSRAISVGHGTDATTRVQQSLGQATTPATSVDASARITGPSFSQGSGVLGINQSAGAANQHSNALSISVGAAPESLDDSVLSQTAARTSVSGAAASEHGERVVEIDDYAFAGSRGVVQLNQSAGVGNRTANNLSIRVVE
ncbi:adhesin [Pseudomonas boanensis]|uniref:adhesin n=1 Tax=Metapseudomonas boanensis TaxID=2822138 RepID=UPI0035D3DA97